MEAASLTVGVVSLIVSLAGFSLAVWQIRKTRSAAESAERAANAARDAVLQAASISDLAQAISLIELLKELHRNQDLGRAVDRYTPLRQLLTLIQSRLSECRRGDFEDVISELIEMEKDVDYAISEGSRIDVVQFITSFLKMQQMLDKTRVEMEVERHMSDTGGNQ